MEQSVAQILIVYGPLGVMTLVAMLVSRKLYLDHEADRKKHAEEIEKLQERIVAKAETWMTKYHELANSLHIVLESMTKRYDSQERSDRRYDGQERSDRR